MADVRQILPTAPERSTEAGQEESSTSRQHIVSNQNRWSRTVLEFRDLAANSWCELNFRISWHPEEKSRTAHDFAVVGLDFLTEDGSSIDFAYVPGLTRAQIDPHNCYIAGPDFMIVAAPTCIREGCFSHSSSLVRPSTSRSHSAAGAILIPLQ